MQNNTIIMLNKIFIVLVAVSASVTSCLGFTSSTFLKTNSFTSKLQDRQNSFLKINEEWRSKVIHMSQFQDFPPQNEEDDYTGDTDWDAEWKKVVSNQDQPKDRPGNYKSDIEIAATKAKVEAEKKLISVQNEAKRMSNFDSLKGDWKFWIGILVVISVGTSLISAAGQTSYNDESFYI